MTNYYAAARVLDELMLELLERGISIPAHVTDDLKAGRTFAGIWHRQPGDADVAMKVTTILQGVEMSLLALAETDFGADYADGWQRKITGAYMEEAGSDKPAPVSRYITGAPKGDRWVRIRPADLAIPDFGSLIGGFSLSCAEQEDGWVMIHGEKEKVSAFLEAVRGKVLSNNA